MYLIDFIGLLVMCVPACVSVSQIGGGRVRDEAG